MLKREKKSANYTDSNLSMLPFVRAIMLILTQSLCMPTAP